MYQTIVGILNVFVDRTVLWEMYILIIFCLGNSYQYVEELSHHVKVKKYGSE